LFTYLYNNSKLLLLLLLLLLLSLLFIEWFERRKGRDRARWREGGRDRNVRGKVRNINKIREDPKTKDFMRQKQRLNDDREEETETERLRNIRTSTTYAS